MNKTIRNLLIAILGIGTLAYVAKKGTQLVTDITDVRDKFKILIGTPRIHDIKNLGFGGVDIAIDSTQIVNQTSITATIENLYVTVKYTDTNGQWQDLLINKNSIPSITIEGNKSNILPPIMLYLDFSSIITLIRIFSGQLPSQLKIVTRFNYAFVGQTIETTVDANQFLAPIKAAISRLKNII
jgi:hypothetical protein